jgi:GntR family carbon starvation induced transcriptional regulator
LPPIEPATKTEAAYQTLRQAILETSLRPSAQLKLGNLRSSFSIGWTPLREALTRLEAEGLVTTSTNRGFCVAPVSRAELEDLTRARLVIEVPLFLESIEKGDAVWEERVVTTHYRLARCGNVVEKPNEQIIRDWEQKHQNFHEALLSASTSNWLLRFYGQILDQLRRHHRFLTLSPMLQNADSPARMDPATTAALTSAMAIEHHTALMEAALDRNFERAKSLMTEHAGYTLDVFNQSERAVQLSPAEISHKTTRPKSNGKG